MREASTVSRHACPLQHGSVGRRHGGTAHGHEPFASPISGSRFSEQRPGGSILIIAPVDTTPLPIPAGRVIVERSTNQQ
jgi:hypothetical protein